MPLTPFRNLLERYEPLAHDSMAMLAKRPESVLGKPWDAAHYIRIFRVEESGVFLEIDTSSHRTSGLVQGLTGVCSHAHPWGSALVLEGPLCWVGTRTDKAAGLIKLAATILPGLGADRTRDYNAEWKQITLVPPCTWHP